MGTVAVFLEAYDDAPDYGILNEVLCAWREDEEKTRADCGLPAVDTQYDGCPNYSATRANRRRTSETEKEQRMSVNDILIQNILHKNLDPTYEPKTVELTEHLLVERDHDHRSLFFNADTNATLWHNYFAINDVKTQYYYRYSGSQTIPPCYGSFVPGKNNRKQTNHWR
jgi:Eukaryotic-type carbonic anhydrase